MFATVRRYEGIDVSHKVAIDQNAEALDRTRTRGHAVRGVKFRGESLGRTRHPERALE